MNNISTIKNCYGCCVCSVVCPKKIIAIELNRYGFYEPVLSKPESCSNCGLCLSVCAYTHSDLSLEKVKNIDGYAAWSNNEQVRRECSSGGVGFEVGKYLIEKGYNACGVRYNVEKERAEHYIATTVEEFIPSMGSKYIQSYTSDAFSQFDKKEKYLITGTPCQIDSLRRYFQLKKMEDNVVLMDFFCHGVPSMLLWKKYLKSVIKNTGKVINVSWRNKQTGWHDSWVMKIEGEKGFINSRLSQGNLFFKMFLGDFCCNPACQKNCKYKYKKSSADIRIGDLWGSFYQNNEKGVSALVTFTAKGNEVIKGLKDCELIQHSFEIIAEGQMQRNAGNAYLSFLAKKMIKNDTIYPLVVWRIIFKVEKLLRLPNRVLNKVKRIAVKCKKCNEKVEYI